MRTIDINGNEIENPDLTKGELVDTLYAPPEAYDTIDNVTKFALEPEEFEHLYVYKELTEEQIAERKRNQELAEAQQNLPETQSDTDDAICALYEQIEAQQAIIDSQDDAICALYEMIGETND